MNRGLLLISLPVVFAGCAPGQPRARTVTLGIVAGFPDGRLCMAVPDSNVRTGVRIPIASIPLVGDTSLTSQGEVEITGPAGSLCTGLWGGYGWADYLVRETLQPTSTYGRGPFVAVVGGAGFMFRGGQAELDLDGDGTAEIFRSCTSNEGLHLTAWRGKALTGRRVWHQYFALGYDVEPSCVPPDYEESP